MPVDGDTYTGNTDFSAATALGDGRIVYVGSASSVTVTGLAGNSTYFFDVYGLCTVSGDYSATPLSGSFTTLAFDPVTLAEWNFPNNPDDAIADGGEPANAASTITVGIDGAGSAPTNLGFGNAGAATRSARADGWDTDANKYYQVIISTVGYYSITVSSAQRSSSTGPRDFKLQYSTDGTSFTDVIAVPSLADDYTSGVLNSVLLPPASSNQATLYLRWITTSTTNIGGGAVGSSGASNIDNIIIQSQPIYYRTTGATAYNVASTWEQDDNPSFSTPEAATIAPPNGAEVYAFIEHNITLPSTRTFGAAAAPSIGGLTIRSGNTLSISSGEELIVRSSIAFEETGLISGAGAFFTLNSGAALATANTAGISTTGATGSVQVTGGRSFNGTANYVYNGSSAQVTGTGLPTTLAAGGSLTIDNGSGVTLSSNTTFTGSLTLTAGALNGAGRTIALNGAVSATGGTLATDGTTTLTIGGSGSLPTTFPFAANSTVGTFTLNRAAAAVGLGTNLTVSGALTLTDGTIALNANTLTLNGAVTAGTGTLTPATGSTLVVGGTGALPGTFPFAAASTIGTLTVTRPGADVVLPSNLTVSTDLSLDASATVTVGANTLQLDGSVSSTGTIAGAGATVSIQGAGAQATLPTVTGSLVGFVLNRSNGALLQDDFAINTTGTLTLIDGILEQPSPFFVQVNNPSTGAIVGGSATAYVDGALTRFTNTTSDYSFPIGDGGRYRNVVVAPNAVTAASYTAEFFATNPSTVGPGANEYNVGPEFMYLRTGGTPDPNNTGTEALVNVSSQEYYDIDGTAAASIELPWETETFDGTPNGVGPDETFARVAHWVTANPVPGSLPVIGSGIWVNAGSVGPTGSSTSGRVRSGVVNTFSPFAIGSNAPVNSLPIELLSFSGERVEDGVALAWNTASELNNDRFEIQRALSASFEGYQTIGTVAGSGTTTTETRYTYTDGEAPTSKVYYRLRQVDYDGTATLSRAIEVGGELSWYLDPNPSTSSQLEFGATGADIPATAKVGVQVVGTNGQVLLSQTGAYAEVRALVLSRLTKAAPGQYIVRVTYLGRTFTLRHLRY